MFAPRPTVSGRASHIFSVMGGYLQAGLASRAVGLPQPQTLVSWQAAFRVGCHRHQVVGDLLS